MADYMGHNLSLESAVCHSFLASNKARVQATYSLMGSRGGLRTCCSGWLGAGFTVDSPVRQCIASYFQKQYQYQYNNVKKFKIINIMESTVDIVHLIESNPITKLSGSYPSKLLTKIKNKFADIEQQMFVASFYCYL
jgi:hypothetical protein